jgi:hypothetical protein
MRCRLTMLTLSHDRNCVPSGGSNQNKPGRPRSKRGMPSRTERGYMLRPHFAPIWLIALIIGVLTSPSLAAGAPDEYDPPEDDVYADQSAYSADDMQPDPSAAPRPTGPSGQAPPGSYTTETWDPEEVNADKGLDVVTSTAPSTWALTGVVIRETDGTPISGASVTFYRDLNPMIMARPDDDAPLRISGTTDADGSFAFVNLPLSGARYWETLTVAASGFGNYELQRMTNTADHTYQKTVELGASAQTYVEATQSVSGASRASFSAATAAGYVSHRYPPPSIRVGEYKPLLPNCEIDLNNPPADYDVKRYPWDFYVLYVLDNEVSPTWPTEAIKAVGQAVHSYAWFHTVNPGRAKDGADVQNNSNQFQCFRHRNRKIDVAYRRVARTIFSHRVLDADNAIGEARHEAGDPGCNSYPLQVNNLAQLGAKDWAEDCGLGDPGEWRDILNVYYSDPPIPGRPGTGPLHVADAFAPRRPNRVSYDNITAGQGKIKFFFRTIAGNSAGRESAVGWAYQIDRCRTFPCGWSRVYGRPRSGFRRALPGVPTSATISAPFSFCYSYRVRAWSPIGWSPYTYFRGGLPICPAA